MNNLKNDAKQHQEQTQPAPLVVTDNKQCSANELENTPEYGFIRTWKNYGREFNSKPIDTANIKR